MKKSSAQWLQRHINDQYVNSSKKMGYRSRAAFKLIEINNQYELLKRNQNILDLGAAPGSWTQVSTEIVGSNNSTNVIAVDLLQMDPIIGADIVQGDIHDESTIAQILELSSDKFDIILSDMAPNTTGHSSTDHLKIIELAETVLELAHDILQLGGSLIIKIFQGCDENIFITETRKYFTKVSRFKPKSSRKESPEIYIIAENYHYEKN